MDVMGLFVLMFFGLGSYASCGRVDTELSIVLQPVQSDKSSCCEKRSNRSSQSMFATLSLSHRNCFYQLKPVQCHGLSLTCISHSLFESQELLRWSNATFGARFTSFVLTPEFIEPALAAGGAWVSTCILTNPLWVVKIKQQTQPLRNNKRKYRGIIGSLRTILREEGVRGWYTGTATSCAGFPGAMLHMPLYEALKRTDDGLQPSAVRVSAAGATSGAFVTTLTYPIEVVRMRLQAQGSRRQGDETRTRYSGALDAFRKILSSEGITSFYRGLGTSLARTVPNSAIALCSYELILRIASTLLANITDPDSMKHQ